MAEDCGSDARLIVTGPERRGYEPGREAQRRLRQECERSGGCRNFLMLVEHPPVITLGRSAETPEVLASEETLRQKGIHVAEVARGGRVTFHGPGQLVCYPILDLRRRGRDLHRYLRDLEAWLIELCTGYGIDARRIEGRTGVWVGERKIAAIGVAARKWCSYHGVALNVSTDLSYFDLIVPCGFGDSGVTSLERELDEPPDWNEVAERAVSGFCRHFGFSDVERYGGVDKIERVKVP